MIRRFARPYAKAIMEVVETAEKARTLHVELSRFDNVLDRSAELRGVFENPAVEASGKSGVVSTIAKRLEISELGVRVLDVLLRNARITDLGDILEALNDMINNATNTVIAEVRSAHDLDETEKQRLRQALEGKLGQTVQLEVETDTSLLGGFVATVGSEVWDASVIAQINKIRD